MKYKSTRPPADRPLAQPANDPAPRLICQACTHLHHAPADACERCGSGGLLPVTGTIR